MLLSPERFIFVLFCSILNKTSCEHKMTIIDGIVSTGIRLQSQRNSDLKNCSTLCYLSSECLVAQFDNAQNCTLFKPGKGGITVNADLTKGNIAIFKLTMTSSCPSTLAKVSFVYSSSTYSYNHTWTTKGSQWILQGCRDTWKQFNRDDGVSVCMKAISGNFTKAMASQYCKKVATVLTGVDSVEECRWIQNQIKYDANTLEYTGYWIDGIRKCPNNDPCYNFIWSDGYTTGNASLVNTNAILANVSSYNKTEEHCLTVAYLPSHKGKTINDCNCNSWNAGYVCGYKLQ